MKCRPNADEDEENYRYCNYIIAEIDVARKLVLDPPRTLSQTKAVLEEIKKYWLDNFDYSIENIAETKR